MGIEGSARAEYSFLICFIFFIYNSYHRVLDANKCLNEPKVNLWIIIENYISTKAIGLN